MQICKIRLSPSHLQEYSYFHLLQHSYHSRCFDQASVTRHFTIHVTSSTGISVLETTPAVVSEEYYNLEGMRLDKPQGLSVVRQRMSDGSTRTMKKIQR